MLKGVNKQIIEIVDTGTVYFEKALLFVKPEYSGEQLQSLKREGERYFYSTSSQIAKKTPAIGRKSKKNINVKNLIILALSISLTVAVLYIFKIR